MTFNAATGGVLQLPEPFSDVTLEWHDYDTGIELIYIGLPNRLIESGAIEPHMVDKIGKGRPARVDSRGFYFQRSTLSEWRLKILRCITDEDFAKTLPGVPEKMNFELLDWLDAHPGRVRVEEERSSDGGTLIRTMTGPMQALIHRGIPEKMFKVGIASPRNHHYDGKAFTCVSKFMRGYYEAEQKWYGQFGHVAPKPAPERESGVRLIWTNPALV